MNSSEKSRLVKKLAFDSGFDACGIAESEILTVDALHLKKWLDAGSHAEMRFMQNHFEKRIDPAKLMEGAKSVIVVLLNYFPKVYPFGKKQLKISRYALGIDYHFVIKKKLTRLIQNLQDSFSHLKGKNFVDSAPILERVWARKAGLGWIGKNSLLLNRQMGSYFFIGGIITNHEFEYNELIEPQHCGTCTRCLDSCPTKAIVSPGVLDSGKCISYQTIENKNQVPEEISRKLNGWIFGCDICQEVCPWNKKLKVHKTEEFLSDKKLLDTTSDDLINLSEGQFNVLFKNSAVKRIKYSKFKGNVEANMNFIS